MLIGQICIAFIPRCRGSQCSKKADIASRDDQSTNEQFFGCKHQQSSATYTWNVMPLFNCSPILMEPLTLYWLEST